MTTMQPETTNPDVPLLGSPYDLRLALGENTLALFAKLLPE